LVARRAHNPKVVGSSPASATTRDPKTFCLRVLFFSEVQVSLKQPVISRRMWMFQGQHHYGGGGIRYPHGHKAGSQHKACNQPFVFGACTRQELHDFVSLVEPELLSIRISVRGRQTFDLFSRMSTRTIKRLYFYKV
jgi:hypothetical protein